ncbi:MAG: Ig-like domain-containing protein [Saprospiraceae bacterium]|nr:Ig-like domain-containing protein [Saprospiraceae bacterium]
MRFFYAFLSLFLFSGCSQEDIQESAPFAFSSFSIDGKNATLLTNISTNPQIQIFFNSPIDSASATQALSLYAGGELIPVGISFENNDSTLVVRPISPLGYLTTHDILVDNQLKDKTGRFLLSACQIRFTTELDLKDKFPRISDDSLMTLVQRQTFAYFWDFAHPVSGLARERNTSGDLVTAGGSGFGIMALLVGVERGFITRQQARERLLKITDFLLHKADRFHGAFSHWLNGATGKAIPFSQRDDGGDLVETSYLMAGLLSASSYMGQQRPDEIKIRSQIDSLWTQVEWNWYTQGQNVLYWHWSPNYQWSMNHRIQGWNECLITYVLAASSPTFPISKNVYDSGWTRAGAMKNSRTFFETKLPVGPDYGGPLFFAHYSFLGLDPRNLKDANASYSEQVVFSYGSIVFHAIYSSRIEEGHAFFLLCSGR